MSKRWEDRGQATVELALVLPIVLLALAVLVHASVVIGVQLGLEHAAREGARAAAVSPDRAHEAARAAASGDGANRVEVVVDATHISVSIARTVDVLPVFPGIGGRTLRAEATMRREDLLNR